MPKIKSIEFKGMQETYDLEVENEDHQYYLANDILTSNSHAVSYAIGSYYAAWFHTYYETDWLGTILQTENSKPDKLAKAIGEIKEMGYTVLTPDINESGTYWKWSDKRKAFIPPLTSIKGVGNAAVKEIMENRPYDTISDLLFNEDGKWRHSKMNKSAFTSLCKVEGFHAIQEMWDGTIKNHKQLHDIIIDNYNILKKSKFGVTFRQAKQTDAVPVMPQLIEDNIETPDWSRIEKLLMYYELCSSTRDDIAFPEELLTKIKNSDVMSAAILPPHLDPRGEHDRKGKSIGWFSVLSTKTKITKGGKPMAWIEAIDHESNTCRITVWGQLPEKLKPFTIWMGEFNVCPQWGPSTGVWKLRALATE